MTQLNDAQHSSNSQTMKIIIAESNPVILQELIKMLREQLLNTMEGVGKWVIYPCSRYSELIKVLSLGASNLLVLGNLVLGNSEQKDYFEIIRHCRDEYKTMSIVLASHVQNIPDFYRIWTPAMSFWDQDHTPRKQLAKIIQKVTAFVQSQKQALSSVGAESNSARTSVNLQIERSPTTTLKGNLLLDVLVENQVKVLKACGGQGRCGTCHVKVSEGMECLSPRTKQEMVTLSVMGIDLSNSRLACQCLVEEGGVSVALEKRKGRSGVLDARPVSLALVGGAL
jgi:ferredoxin